MPILPRRESAPDRSEGALLSGLFIPAAKTIRHLVRALLVLTVKRLGLNSPDYPDFNLILHRFRISGNLLTFPEFELRVFEPPVESKTHHK
jgi:hypothetical protein